MEIQTQAEDEPSGPRLKTEADQPRRDASEETNLVHTLISDLQPPELFSRKQISIVVNLGSMDRVQEVCKL